VTDQSARKHSCLRANWEVTIMPGDPKWCELFLILYRTIDSTKLKNNRCCNSWFLLFIFSLNI